MRVSIAAVVALAASIGLAAPCAAQQEMQADRAGWQESADQDRSTIMDFLARPDVGAAAEQTGVDLQDVGRRVLEMNAGDASRVAGQVREVEQQLAAQNITITTTALIIALLVLIVLILVVD